jgi:hypothetical protein
LEEIALQIILYDAHAQSKLSLGTSKTGLVGTNFSQRHVFDQNTFLAIKLRYTTESSFPLKKVGDTLALQACSRMPHGGTTCFVRTPRLE